MAIQSDEVSKLLFNVADRLEVVEKIVEGGDESKLMSAIRRASRERRLMADETASSEQINATAAERLLSIREGLAELKDEIRLLADSAKTELLAKERSATNSTRLLQEKMSYVESQVASLTEDVGQLVSVANTATNRADQAVALVDSVTDRFTRLGEDGALKAELRKMASGAAEAGSADFVREIAMQMIRQGIESGLLAPGPKALQPKPERAEA